MTTSVRWSSKTAFIFAAASAAIGLGNVWRFPFVTGQNGGGAFVLLYLLCVLVLALPLLIAEIALGRMGRQNPISSIKQLALDAGRSYRWAWMGFLMVLTSYLIVTYYVVIVGWVLDYFVRAVQGQLHFTTDVMAKQQFSLLQKNLWSMVVCGAVVVFLACLILVMGIKKGLERAVYVIFPAMFVLLVLLLIYAMTTGHFAQGMAYLFYPDFSKLTAKVFVMALGQAFFSVGVGMGITLMFSAYLPEGMTVIEGAVGVVLADTGFALLAGMIIFPIVFAHHLSPEAGPALIFQTLPLAFSNIPMSTLVASAFFLMLFLAAFSSVIALIEPAVCCVIECYQMQRKKAVLLLGVLCWLLSLCTVGSFVCPEWFSYHGVSFFEALDYLTASIMLPVSGVLMALFVGWCLQAEAMSTELSWSSRSFSFRFWRFCMRWVVPVVIVMILLSAVGLL